MSQSSFAPSLSLNPCPACPWADLLSLAPIVRSLSAWNPISNCPIYRDPRHRGKVYVLLPPLLPRFLHRWLLYQMSCLVSGLGYRSWAPRPENLIVEEVRSQLCGQVGRRGRFLSTVYRTGCPLFSKADDGWFLDVCVGSRIMLSLSTVRRLGRVIAMNSV